ncbi:MAG: TonB-dependent receptor [Novosphingobium sp.]|nr:TonB-dependent receptor [Novosphingobium sp.]
MNGSVNWNLKSGRATFLAGAAALIVGLPATALAQDTGELPAIEYSGNEIVVTATKREQTLQEIPVAVTVTPLETIERAQVRDIMDLQGLVTSLRVRQNQSSANANFFIRGFGNGANNAGIEPSVGVFIDNVYRSRAAAQIADLPDIERVEVLRGPQSTLFGKNASAGIINIVTRKPQFTFGGNVEASYGNFDAMVFKGVVTGPVSDSIAASLAGSWNKRDGFTRDLGTGNRTDERNRWFVRGQVLFDPGSDLSVRLIGDYGEIDENCCAALNVRSSSATNAIRLLGGQVNSADDPLANVVYSNFDSTNLIKNYGVSGQIDYDLGGAQLTSISSWRKTTALTSQDSDFTSADILGRNDQRVGYRTITQEFRVTGNLLDRVTALLGFYYFNEKITDEGALHYGTQARPYIDLVIRGATGGAFNVPLLEQTFGALEGNPAKYVGKFFAPETGIDTGFRLKDEAFSVFTQFDVEVAERLTFTGGLNYTHDKKRFSTDTFSSDAFSAIDVNSPFYAPLRNQVLFQGGLASQVGTILGLGRSATAAEIQAFAGANPAAFGQVAAAVQAFANANQNNPAVNPLNALRPLQFLPPFLNVPNAVETGKTSDNNVSWTARLSYEATDQITLYGGVAKGFKASSINLSRGSRPSLADRDAIQSAGLGLTNLDYGSRYAGPEKSTVYEIGIKTDWGIAGANLALFQQEIKGFQSNIFNGVGFLLANAGKQSVKGFEFEGFVKPVEPMRLGLSVTYLDPKYDSFPNSAFGDATGLMPADIPPLSATFTFDYDLELANTDHVYLHADYAYESPTQNIEGLPAFIVKDPTTGEILDYQPGLDAARPFKRQVDMLNASVTYAMHNGLELSVWGRNLLDDRYISQIFDSPIQTGSVTGYTNHRRTYGFAGRFRW